MTSALFFLLSLCFILFLLCCIAIFYLMYTARQKPQSALNNIDYLIVYASQSGQAEQYAKHTAADLIHANYSVGLVDIADLSPEILFENQKVLWIVSTYGEGDGPDTAQSFIDNFLAKPLDLKQQQYAILALGDRRYTHFCAFGARLEAWLIESGARALFEQVQVDQMQQHDLDQFSHALCAITGMQSQQFSSQHTWHLLRLQQRTLLNSGSLGTGLYHLKFSLDSSIDWQSGDIASIQCRNTAQHIADFLRQHQLDSKLATKLQHKNLRLINGTEFQVTELATWPDLPQREYSIASLPSEQSLDLVVRHQIGGLGSGLLTQELPLDHELQLTIRANPNFHLDGSHTPCIFIGNGSGIAGLLAHIKQRHIKGQHQNWLIYGERQRAFDTIFDQQLSTWQHSQHLQLDRVYSRDGEQDRYVQDVLLRQADQLRDWVARGAIIYVCGSLTGMAQGVDTVLLHVLGQAEFNALKQQKRYLRDVY